MQELARKRVENPSPLLGDSVCPAGQYTFSVRDQGTTNWRNPTPEERQALIQAISETGKCCQGLPDAECWARQQT